MDVIIGLLLVVFSVGMLLFLVVWSRQIIERIHNKRLESYRQIAKDMKNGQ
jgi:hypothetical protein